MCKRIKFPVTYLYLKGFRPCEKCKPNYDAILDEKIQEMTWCEDCAKKIHKILGVGGGSDE